jgi:hypothetical protein
MVTIIAPKSGIISLLGIGAILVLSTLVVPPLQNQAFAASSAEGAVYEGCSPVYTTLSWTPFGGLHSGFTFITFAEAEPTNGQEEAGGGGPSERAPGSILDCLTQYEGNKFECIGSSVFGIDGYIECINDLRAECRDCAMNRNEEPPEVCAEDLEPIPEQGFFDPTGTEQPQIVQQYITEVGNQSTSQVRINLELARMALQNTMMHLDMALSALGANMTTTEGGTILDIPEQTAEGGNQTAEGGTILDIPEQTAEGGNDLNNLGQTAEGGTILDIPEQTAEGGNNFNLTSED